MTNLSARILWGCVHLLTQRASREPFVYIIYIIYILYIYFLIYDETLPSMECMALDGETININNCRRKKQDLSVSRSSRKTQGTQVWRVGEGFMEQEMWPGPLRRVREAKEDGGGCYNGAEGNHRGCRRQAKESAHGCGQLGTTNSCQAGKWGPVSMSSFNKS